MELSSQLLTLSPSSRATCCPGSRVTPHIRNDFSADFEGYFEGLRLLAGEPGVNSTGRVLPKYDPKWKDLFVDVVVKARVGWWERERRKAETQVQAAAAKMPQVKRDHQQDLLRVRL